MSCRINLVNKKTGITYVYESTSFRDKEKKQPRNKRICIGKLDPISGELIASKRLTPEQAAVRDPAVTASAEVVGPSIILDAITETWVLENYSNPAFLMIISRFRQWPIIYLLMEVLSVIVEHGVKAMHILLENLSQPTHQ